MLTFKELKSSFSMLCTFDWSTMPDEPGSSSGSGPARLTQMLKEFIRRGADVNMSVGTIPLLRLAIGSKCILPVISLISAGADTTQEVLGEDLIKLMGQNNLSEHIPAITEYLMRTQIELTKKKMEEAPAKAPAVEIIGESDSSYSNGPDVL